MIKKPLRIHAKSLSDAPAPSKKQLPAALASGGSARLPHLHLECPLFARFLPERLYSVVNIMSCSRVCQARIFDDDDDCCYHFKKQSNTHSVGSIGSNPAAFEVLAFH